MDNTHECDCGHIAGSPFTLRAHQKEHEGEVKKTIVKAIKAVKKAVKWKK